MLPQRDCQQRVTEQDNAFISLYLFASHPHVNPPPRVIPYLPSLGWYPANSLYNASRILPSSVYQLRHVCTHLILSSHHRSIPPCQRLRLRECRAGNWRSVSCLESEARYPQGHPIAGSRYRDDGVTWSCWN